MNTRRATEGSAGVLDSTSRSPTERNAVYMPGSAAAVESPVEMRARVQLLNQLFIIIFCYFVFLSFISIQEAEKKLMSRRPDGVS